MKTRFRFSLYSLSTGILLLAAFQCVCICVVIYFTKPSLLHLGPDLQSFAEDKDFKLTFSSDDLLLDSRGYAYARNKSFCNFKFGQREKFDLSNASVSYSIELGPKSPYNVIYNVVESTYKLNEEGEDTVTYCTHATPIYIHHVVELAKRWDGPISVALFVPGYDAALSLLIIDQLCVCFREMVKVSFHFIYPASHPPDLSSLYSKNDSLLDFGSVCSLPEPISRGTLKTYRNDSDLIYPVNVHRNVARQAANTYYVLVSDVELLPSIGFVPSFLKMLKKFTWREPHVYVLPVFEVEKSVKNIPKTKHQLQQLYHEGKAVYFHRWVCLHCQLFYGLSHWIHESPLGDLKPRFIVRRHFPYHRWEPIFVGTHQEPLYDEALSWEGRQEKMIQLHTMCLLDYKFVILNNAFLVHVPGVKRRGGENNTSRQKHVIANQRLYVSLGQTVEKKLHRKTDACRLR